MKALIIYDSVYGNTEKVAKAIAGAIAPPHEVRVLRAAEAKPSELGPFDLLVVGSPTHGGRQVPAIRDFLDKVPGPSVKGVKVAAFDTRTSSKVSRIFGHAAGRIAHGLEQKGGVLAVPAEGFFVDGSKGPLKEGELERSAAWAKKVLETVKK